MDKKNLTKNKQQQKRPWKLWIAWIPIALTLVGCEPARDILSRFPGFEPPATEPETTAQSPAVAKMEAEIRQRINKIPPVNNPLVKQLEQETTTAATDR
jgi:hypothetical protein